MTGDEPAGLIDENGDPIEGIEGVTNIEDFLNSIQIKDPEE